MGIKNLNRYLMNNCSNSSISKKSLSEFRNKVLAIDTSIYLYKFVETDTFIESFYNMIIMFRKYNIIPLFVFDGKPPAEKKELLEKRRNDKQDAEHKYNELKIQLETSNGDAGISNEKETELKNEMEILKKKFVRLKYTDIQLAKDLMTTCGVHYIESYGEADQLCVYLVQKSYAWACVSDDMDMIVYGCPRVIRHISLMNHTGVVYDTISILQELRISWSSFRDVMVLSGTDYNIHDNTNLTETLKWYQQYIHSNENISFYDWLDMHTEYISDKSKLEGTREMFDLTNFSIFHQDEMRNIIAKMPFRNGNIQYNELHAILKTDGFIFT
jgi:hypothetical protein